MIYAITESFISIRDFMEAGGSVLWLIALLVLLMWGLIFERIYYLSHGHDVFLDSLVSKWDSRADKTSWHALQIREKFLAEAKSSINRNTTLIKTCIALAPLFGLLGTVTGMIEVFQVMAFSGGGDFTGNRVGHWPHRDCAAEQGQRHDAGDCRRRGRPAPAPAGRW